MNKQLKSYTATIGKKPFNWNEFLDRDEITNGQWTKATILAGSWVTCACGTQCAIIPRTMGGTPEDNRLYHFGNRFYDAINAKRIQTAKAFLALIEERSAELIAELLTAPSLQNIATT